MPSARKQKILEKSRKRTGRGRNLLIGIILLIAVISISIYVYATVTAPKPDFAIQAPSGVTIHSGTETDTLINVTSINQFSGTITLTATGSQGLTASITPSTVTGSGQATLKTTASNNGTYTVTITGTSGNLSHSATVGKVDTPVYATFVTSKGTMVVELYQAQAPITVANFVTLAQSGFYNNLTWHRVGKAGPIIIQTGDPTSRNGGGNNNTWGQHGSSQTIPRELDPSLHNYNGYLGMARGQDVNSASSQFYINLADNTSLDGSYAVFGKVLSGLSVANALLNVPNYPDQFGPLDGQPITNEFLTSVTITS